MTRRELMLLLAGAALVRPDPVRARQQAPPVIGILARVGMIDTVFQQTLEEIGYVDGRNVVIDSRYLHMRDDQVAAAAADLVRRKVDVIAAFGSATARAAKRATQTIPIVFTSMDPVLEGLVASLARPGGNLTGVSRLNSDLMPKRLELLSRFVPRVKRFGLLVDPDEAEAAAVIRKTKAASRVRGVALDVLQAHDNGEIYAAFDTLGRLHIRALIVDFDPILNLNAGTLAGLAAVAAIPAIYGWSGSVQAGGLISYGQSPAAIHRMMAVYVAKIIAGAKPADLPVVEIDKFELAINMGTAKSLGLTIPPSVLALADRVIE